MATISDKHDSAWRNRSWFIPWRYLSILGLLPQVRVLIISSRFHLKRYCWLDTSVAGEWLSFSVVQLWPAPLEVTFFLHLRAYYT
jgi:hypothetical protein